MLDLKAFISQSLSPAIALSAIGLLTLGLHNRMTALGGRIREINQELRLGCGDARRQNIQQQLHYFFIRIKLVRNALFFLYGAMGMMVFTAVAIALHELDIYFARMVVPVWTFISGLLLMFMAVLSESFAIILNLKTLELDTQFSSGNGEGNNKD
ncbi:MAG: DUF2721 domain-containing protein [Vampirovibrio sp.]|nr:DUF2721 domain-containing protein [Vampirovibrio sp.]